MATYDGVVIGAGHNGLTLAAYLTRVGLRVAVLERNAWIGGGCTTEEPALPGFRFNLHSNYYIGFRHSPLVRDLELYRFGFAYVEPPVQQAATFRDGTCLVIHKDIEATCASLSRFSKRDADAFRHLYQTYAVQMQPLFTSLLYNSPLPPDVLRDRLSGPQGRELLSNAAFDLFGVIRKHFEDERIRTLFTSYMHVITAENEPGTGLLFPMVFANVTNLALPAGGSVAFTDALRRVVEAGGGEVRVGAEVKEIVVERGRAIGVRLADAEFVGGRRFVASAIDAPATMHMAGDALFPAPVRQKLNNWHWGHHSLVTIHLALRDAPQYRSRGFDPNIGRAFNVFFGFDDTAQVARCFDDCKAGKFPTVLMGNGACNSQFDPTYAPSGRHVAFWWPFAPYALEDGPEGWDRRRAQYTERLLAVWQQYASNLEGDNVLAMYLFTPLDVERRNANMVRGAVRMGAYVPSQLGMNRPHPLLADSRTPIEGLYLCGSSNHGGGVNGAPGYNAANVIVDDLKLERPWPRVPPPEWRG